MTKELLLELLNSMDNDDDPEANHILADGYLLDYINDQDIRDTYEKLTKWYA